MAQIPPYIGKLLWDKQVVGTAFLVHQDGLIGTCYHVVKEAIGHLVNQSFIFQFLHNGHTLPAIVEMLDPKYDVALLRTQEPLPSGTMIATLIRSDNCRNGMEFQSAGAGKLPDNGYNYEYESAIGSIVGLTRRDDIELLQLKSQQILLGMSGGPVVAEALNGVVGIISGRYTPPPGEHWMRDTAWAIPIESLVGLDNRLKTHYIFNPLDVRNRFGLSIRQVDLMKTIPATGGEITQYYEGAPLTWNVIVAEGDVKRDQCDKLIQQYSVLPHQVNMLCLSGEPGAGKTTLAWRIAAEIAQATGQPLLQIRNSEQDTIWYSLEAGAKDYNKPLIILVDDVFRNNEANRALASLDPTLKLTIIATSCSNEIPNHLRLPFLWRIEELSEPTPTEKAGVLIKLGLQRSSLTESQRVRLHRANSWFHQLSGVKPPPNPY